VAAVHADRHGGDGELTLLGHPVCGRSWEGFAIEQLVTQLSHAWQVSYYRTSA
jgi:hypothetical protein